VLYQWENPKERYYTGEAWDITLCKIYWKGFGKEITREVLKELIYKVTEEIKKKNLTLISLRIEKITPIKIRVPLPLPIHLPIGITLPRYKTTFRVHASPAVPLLLITALIAVIITGLAALGFLIYFKDIKPVKVLGAFHKALIVAGLFGVTFLLRELRR
jgi:hypothetical protein